MNLTTISSSPSQLFPFSFSANRETFIYAPEEIKEALLKLGYSYVVGTFNEEWGLVNSLHVQPGNQLHLMSILPKIDISQLGGGDFCKKYGVKYPYMSGAMANGIASAALVIAMSKAGFLGSFGAAGFSRDRLAVEIHQIKKAIGELPFCINLIHSPSEEKLEKEAVELYIEEDISVVEASAFLDLTPHIVRFKASGLRLMPDGNIQKRRRVIAKISRKEVAEKFMKAPPIEILTSLVEQGHITPFQAKLATKVSVADDITVEADSGGHTDNRPLVGLLPSIISLKNQLAMQYPYIADISVGAAGGIGTPAAAAAAFSMGAAYVVTGSINQASVEAGTSPQVKELLAQATIPDVMMAPAADMFEMGVEVQVLKRGSMFGMRAQKLYEYYKHYESLAAIPPDEIRQLEQQLFKKPLEDIWEETKNFFEKRDPDQISRAEQQPKRKMALMFRWYLGLSSYWATKGQSERKVDYQIWCGPSMGSFNQWVKSTYLQEVSQRKVADIARHIMLGTIYQLRLQQLTLAGFPALEQLKTYKPEKKYLEYLS